MNRSDRLPFAPVDALKGDIDDGTLAEKVGVDRKTIVRWRRHGVTWDNADRLAARLGWHAETLWPDEWARLTDAAVAQREYQGTLGPSIDAGEQLELVP